MQYHPTSVDNYFELIADDWRKDKILEIKNFILDCNPNVNVGIQYNMLHFSLPEGSVLNLNAQKNFVGMYVGNLDLIDPNRKLLIHFDCGKTCIRIKKSNALHKIQLQQIILKCLDLVKSGTSMNC